MTIKVTASTMGRGSPASVAAGTGYYRYRGDQPEQQRGEREPLPQNRAASAAKRARFAEYTRRRLNGETRERAGQAIGISASTRGYYERAFRDEHPEAGDA